MTLTTKVDGCYPVLQILTTNDNLANLNDYQVLMKHGWLYEYYDADGPELLKPEIVPSTYINHAFWFDRDGVDTDQATYWNYKDGITYNTGGVYDVEISFHSIDPTNATMFATINGEQQGFYTDGYVSDAPPTLMPVGRSFTGDMTQMQAFWGRGGGGGVVSISNIEVSGCFVLEEGMVTGGGWIDSPAGAASIPQDILLNGPLADAGWGGDYTRDMNIVCDPNNTPIEFSGWVEANSLTDNGALLLGLLDKKWIDDGNHGFLSGAYAYFGRRGTNLRIGPSDGNAGGELNQTGANVTFDPWENVRVNFSMEIYNGDVTVSYGGNDYVDTYGEVPSGLTWDEFYYGAYPGVDLWSPGGSVNYSVTVSGCEIAPSGKANFGFISKYKKGADAPIGNTEFIFQAGDINFHSIDYEWLVVNKNDSRAQFKGTGTINNEGIYKFMLWAGDNEPDTFRIKIWYEENGSEVVVYDNGMEQAIAGGNIVVHTSKK